MVNLNDYINDCLFTITATHKIRRGQKNLKHLNKNILTVIKVRSMSLFPICSVWAATTCWTPHSGKTPACSVGALDSPATASTTASPCETCRRVRRTFSTWSGKVRQVVQGLCLLRFQGYNQMFIIPAGATTISIRESVSTRNYLGELCSKCQRSTLLRHEL